MKVVWAALSALSVGACSLIYTGDGLVGPGPDAGGGDANVADAPNDASDDALDEKAPVVVDGQTGIGGVAIDATYLYWTTENGKVTRRKREGATTDEEIATGENKPGAIAVDTTHVYWTATKAVRRRTLGTGTVEDYASTIEDPSGLTLHPLPNGTLVYWTERSGGFLKSKGVSETIVADKLDRPGALALSAEKVFIVIKDGDVHGQAPFGAGINVKPAIEGRRVSAIAGTASRLYFASASNNTLGRYDPSATSAETTTIVAATGVGLACDGGFLYFVDQTRSRIRRLIL